MLDNARDTIKAAADRMVLNRRLFPIIVSLSRGPKSQRELVMEFKVWSGRGPRIGACLKELLKLKIVARQGQRYCLVAYDPRLVHEAVAQSVESVQGEKVTIGAPTKASPALHSASEPRMAEIPPQAKKISERFKVPAYLFGAWATPGPMARCECGAASILRYGTRPTCYKCAREKA